MAGLRGDGVSEEREKLGDRLEGNVCKETPPQPYRLQVTTMNAQSSNRKDPHKASPGPKLIKGMQAFRDALRDGEHLPDRFTMRTVELVLEPREYSADEVVKLRENLRASQGVFAKLLGVSIKTLQAWEQGGNPPSPIARRLLETIEENPQPWVRKLSEAASIS